MNRSTSSSPSPYPSPPSEIEGKFYYAGLPSGPILVARSSTTPWEEEAHSGTVTGTGSGSGLEANAHPRRKKVLRMVGSHRIKSVWEEGFPVPLDAQVLTLLESMKVKWTSLDFVRIGYDGESPSSAPVIFWIGVDPKSLSNSDGVILAHKCREILEEKFQITDVDVEIHEPVVI